MFNCRAKPHEPGSTILILMSARRPKALDCGCGFMAARLRASLAITPSPVPIPDFCGFRDFRTRFYRFQNKMGQHRRDFSACTKGPLDCWKAQLCPSPGGTKGAFGPKLQLMSAPMGQSLPCRAGQGIETLSSKFLQC